MVELLKAEEVSEMLRVKPARIYELTREKKIPHIVIGERQYRYTEKMISDWIENGGNRDRKAAAGGQN
jgi:excisionase family DNA binding protein